MELSHHKLGKRDKLAARAQKQHPCPTFTPGRLLGVQKIASFCASAGPAGETCLARESLVEVFVIEMPPRLTWLAYPLHQETVIGRRFCGVVR